MDIRLLLVPYDSGQHNVRMGEGTVCAAALQATGTVVSGLTQLA